MSLLHPNEDDEAFAQGHAETGRRKMEARIKRLEELLQRAQSWVPTTRSLRTEIDKALKMTFYDEEP